MKPSVSRERLERFVKGREWYQSFEFLAEFGVKATSDSDAKWRALALPPLDGKVVLDLGCATGYMTFRALQEGAAIAIGVDHDLDGIAAACAIRDHIVHERRAIFVHTQIENFLAQTLSSFDVVVAASVGHYLNLPMLLRRFMHGAADLVVLELPYVPSSNYLHVSRGGQIVVPGERALAAIAKAHEFSIEKKGESEKLDADERAVFHFRALRKDEPARRGRGTRARAR